MSPETAALIARIQAMPKKFEVVVLYDDGSRHTHQTAMRGQAESYAHHLRGYMGRDLISRNDDLTNGPVVRVVSVEVAELA